MILRSNLSKIIDIAQRGTKVLDVGGWHCPFNSATHVIDICPYETRRQLDALDSERRERFDATSWIIHDVCVAPWPFPDKFFDFSFCSHLLEDVRDPITVCRELIRVSKSGYIETPSREREIFSKSRFFRLKMALGQFPEIGFRHHRWFVERDGNGLIFTAKDQHLLESRDHFLTRSEVGRKLSEAESGIGLFWQHSFDYAENFKSSRKLAAYKRGALNRLKNKPELNP